MFWKPKISVNYNNRLKRVVLYFKASECLKFRKPPSQPLSKARIKLNQELEDGQIECFELYDRAFAELWQHIRKHEDDYPPDKMLEFTLAQGGRSYREITVERSKNPQFLAELSCDFLERKAATLTCNAFIFDISHKIKKIGVQDRLDYAALRFIYLMMKSGQPIKKWPLKKHPDSVDFIEQKINVELDQDNRIAILYIYDEQLLRDPSTARRVYERAVKILKKANTEGHDLNLLTAFTFERLNLLQARGESLGFHLPASILFAFDRSYRFDAWVNLNDDQAAAEGLGDDALQWRGQALSLHQQKLKSEYFDIEIDSTLMSAQIRAVNQKLLEKIGKKLTLEWLISEFKKCGVHSGYDDYIDSVLTRMGKKAELRGVVIAKGKAPQRGNKTYLHELWKHPKLSSDGQIESMRDRQNTRLARAGQLIAEVRFSDATPGMNVMGEALFTIGSASEAQIEAGAGVSIEEEGRFYANQDGLIEWDGSQLSIIDTYVHEGNVNMSSGNLAFKGAVVIRGSIEAGATVEVQGSLVVEGTIAESLVKVRENLDVAGGILTTMRGQVTVGGNCTAQFVENSRIHVKGRLEVETSLLNSLVVCGQQILIRDGSKGLISGGQISCWEAIGVQNLGLNRGQITTCRIGTHYSTELRWNRLELRQKAVSTNQEALARFVKEQQGSNRRKTTESESQLKLAQDRLKKADRILKTIEQSLDRLEKSMQWNRNATIAVRGVLDRNVDIHATGKKLKNSQNLAGVLISASSYRGEQITDLGDIEGFLRAWPEAVISPLATGK